jgi:hypothetical protein
MKDVISNQGLITDLDHFKTVLSSKLAILGLKQDIKIGDDGNIYNYETTMVIAQALAK